MAKTKPKSQKEHDMRSALALCSLALNPLAPSPTASMVRLSDGYLTSFGGTFAISVPMPITVEACFSPTAIAPFFRKERGPVSYTLKNNKLQLKEGKEQLTIKCLPPEEMVTLDVLGAPQACEFNTTHLKIACDVINPSNERVWAQGISMRNGMMESTNNAIVVSAISDLPDELVFNLPVDSAKALLKFKSPVVSVNKDQRAVKFTFKDGSILCSLFIEQQMIETRAFFQGVWTPLKLTEELSDIECEHVLFRDGDANYLSEGLEGCIEDCVDPSLTVDIAKESLDVLLLVSKDLRISDDGNRLQAFGENCRVIASTRRVS